MRVVGRGELEKTKKTTKKLENSYVPLALHKISEKTEFKHFQQPNVCVMAVMLAVKPGACRLHFQIMILSSRNMYCLHMSLLYMLRR